LKRYEIIVYPKALADIREAYFYIKSRSPMNAERWLQGIWKAIDELEMFPSGCAAAREEPKFGEELRQFVYKSHRIVFEVAEDEVHVLYVRHGSRERFNRE
jgi:plasmid stabilization system protein ParE